MHDVPGSLDERIGSAKKALLVDQLVACKGHNQIVTSVVHHLSSHDYFSSTKMVKV